MRIPYFRIVTAFTLLMAVALALPAQSEKKENSPLLEKWLKKKEDFKFQTTAMVQLWGIYSTGENLYDEEKGGYAPVDDRFNIQLRRARLVFRGEPYERLRFTVALFYDLAGRDLLVGSVGGTNPAQPDLGVWDAFLQYQLKKESQLFFLTGGWFRPQMQRESITSGWATNSFEKSMSQNYVRRHLVGQGPGRAAGLNLGGLLLGEKVGLNYNVGVFNPLTTAFNGGSVGLRFSPLLTARTVVYLGDPEMTKYRTAYEINYYSERKGLSLDFNVSTQGQTDLFESSFAYGPGLLFNWGHLNVDGEWIFMTRSGSRPLTEGEIRDFDYQSNSGHLRVGYNIWVGRFLLEPTGMIMQFNGGFDAEAQADAETVGAFSGNERTYDLGVNLYLDRRNLKLMLHYTWHEGDPGDAGAGARVNQYFSQTGVGAIQRGNWLGLGLNAIF